MTLLDELEDRVDKITRTRWDVTNGTAVPATADLRLGNNARRLDATMFYADLAESTRLVSYEHEIASEVYKAFLLCGSKIIQNRGGHVRSFDGDRVMGVFVGNPKNTPAVRAALELKYVFEQVIVRRFKEQYSEVGNDDIRLGYCAGIDTGAVRVARVGVRGSNDLVWVGQAANVAAKLSTLREDYSTYITKAVYDGMLDKAKYGGSSNQNMWESRRWQALPSGKRDLYRSNWRWKL